MTTKGRLTVSEAASLCNVGRNTAGYWIRTGKLYAERSGNKYLIPVEELVAFLKLSGKTIPAHLAFPSRTKPYFRKIESCWNYWNKSSRSTRCRECVAKEKNWNVCFLSKEGIKTKCTKHCASCDYFKEMYFPRTQFLHQFNVPAAVFKDLFIWAGNEALAGLCGLGQNDLIGLGLERIFHTRSLETVIASENRRALNDPMVPRTYRAAVRDSDGHPIECNVTVNSLREPSGAFCLFAEPLDRAGMPVDKNSGIQQPPD